MCLSIVALEGSKGSFVQTGLVTAHNLESNFNIRPVVYNWGIPSLLALIIRGLNFE